MSRLCFSREVSQTKCEPHLVCPRLYHVVSAYFRRIILVIIVTTINITISSYQFSLDDT